MAHINWRPESEIAEEGRYGGSQRDQPHCRRCGNLIRGDDWRGGPVVGYICGACELKLDDLRHDADVERDWPQE